MSYYFRKKYDINTINEENDENIEIQIDNEIINENKFNKNIKNRINKNILDIKNATEIPSQTYTDVETDVETETETEIIDKIYNKKEIIKRIETKIYKLDKRMKYIDYKYEDIRKSYRYYSLSIIYYASILTLLEGFINTINLNTIIKNNILIKLINFIPLILSTLITLCGTLIKYNSFEERIEEIIRVKDKSILTLAKFKNLIEDLHFCDNSNYRKKKRIIDNYKNNAYTDYLDCQTKIEKFLKYKDYKKYIPKVEEFETIIETGWNDKKESNNKSNNKSNNESKNSLLKIIRTLTCNYYNDEDIDKDKDKNKDNYDISLAKKSMKRKINN